MSVICSSFRVFPAKLSGLSVWQTPFRPWPKKKPGAAAPFFPSTVTRIYKALARSSQRWSCSRHHEGPRDDRHTRATQKIYCSCLGRLVGGRNRAGLIDYRGRKRRMSLSELIFFVWRIIHSCIHLPRMWNWLGANGKKEEWWILKPSLVGNVCSGFALWKLMI